MSVLAKPDGLDPLFRRAILVAGVVLCVALPLGALADSGQIKPEAGAPAENPSKPTGESDEGANHALILVVAVACATLLLGCTWSALHRPAEQAEHRFWLRLLAPLSNLEGLDLVRAVDGISTQWHDYPDRGRIRISKEQAFFWMGVLKLTDSDSLRRERTRRRADEHSHDAQQVEGRRQAESDLFWMHLLAPILHLADDEAREALADLVGTPQAHPHDGLQNYDVPTLNERLLWAQSTSPENVVARWRQTHAPENDLGRPIAEADASLRDTVQGARTDGWSSPPSRRQDRKLTM